MALDGVLNTTKADSGYMPGASTSVQPYSVTTVPGISERGPLQTALTTQNDWDVRRTPMPTVNRGGGGGAHVAVPRLLTPADVQSGGDYERRRVNPIEVKPTLPQYGEFEKGLRRSVPQTQGLLASAGAAFADLTGNYDTAGNLNYYAEQKQLEANAPELKAVVESYKDVDSISKFGDYFLSKLGEQTINMAATVASGGLGGIAANGSRILSGALAGAVEKKAAQLVAAGVAPDAARAAAVKAVTTTIGAQAGALAPEFALNTGENYQQDVQQHGLMGTSPGMDVGAGILQSAVTLLGGESQLLRKLTGVKVPSAVERSFKQKLQQSAMSLPKAMIGEGAEEYTQEFIGAVNSMIQDGRAHLVSDDFDRMMECAVAGGLVGFASGGASVMTDMLKAAPKTTEPVQTSDQTAVDLLKVHEQELAKLDPFTQVTKAEQMMRDAVSAEAQAAVSTSQESFSKHRDPIVKALRDTKSELIQAKAGTSPKFALLATQESKAKYIKNLETKQQKYIAQLARLAEAQRTDIKNRKKQFEADLSTSDKKARKAFRQTVESRFQNLGYDSNLTAEQIVDDRNYQQALFKKDPVRYNAIREGLQDTSTYVQRQLNRANTTMSKLNMYKGQLNVDLELADQGAIQLSPREYEFLTSELASTERELTRMAREKAALRKSSVDFAKNVAKHNDPFTMQTEQDAIFAKADKLNPVSSSNLDIKAKLRSLEGKQLQDRIDALRKESSALSATARATGNTDYDFDASFADWQAAQLGSSNQQLALDAAPTEVERAFKDMQQNADLEQAAQFTTQFGLDKQAADQFMRNAIMEQQQRAYEASPAYQAQLKVQQDKESYVNALDGNLPTRQALPEQTSQTRRDLEAEQLKRMYKQEQRAKYMRRNADQQRAAFERYTVQEKEVDFALAAESTQQVYSWMRNTLDSLPGLKDVVNICTSVSDSSVPTEVHDALVNLSFQSNTAVPQAMYYDGKIYVFADRLKSKSQAVRVLMHEGVAHYGLRAIMTPRQFTTFMAGVYRDAYDTPLWREFERKRPAYEKANDLVRTEEFVAWLAETETPKSLLERIPVIKDIWKFITKLFTKLFGADGFVTEADVRDVLAVSAQNLASKTPKGVNSKFTPWGRALHVTGGMDNVTPQYQASELVGVDAFTAPYGWGTYFSNPAKLASYFQRFNTRASGLPGQVFRNYAPTIDQFMVWEQPISAQPYVAEHLTKVFKKFPPQVMPAADGAHVMFLGKEVAVYNNSEELQKYMQDKTYLSNVTGQTVYEFLVDQAADPKSVTLMLRSLGLAGTSFKFNNNQSYCLFEGDTTQSSTPGYADNGVRFMVESDTTYEDMPDLYLEQWAQAQLNQQSWTKKMQRVKQVGKSTGLDGKLIEHNMSERMIEGLYDKNRRVQVVQRFIKETVGPKVLTAATNIYRHMTGMVNRINSMRCDIVNSKVQPLAVRIGELNIPAVNQTLDKLRAAGRKVTETDRVNAQWAALDEYLYARHASERNAEINKRYRGKNKLEAASGLSDTQAQAVLDKYSDVVGMEEVAREFDKLGRFHLDLIDKYGLVPKQLTDKLRATYKHYVPLTGWEEFIDDINPDYAHKRSKAGISVGGREILKKSSGREGLAESPSTRLILQITDTVNLGEKNDVSRRLLALAQKVPNDDLWEVVTERDEKGRPYFKLSEKGDGTLAYVRKSHKLAGQDVKFINVIDSKGNRERVAVHDKALAAALRNENTVEPGAPLQFIRKFTQLFSATLTTYNPVFAIKNYPRDIATAIINVGNVISESQANNLLGKENNIRQRIVKDATSMRMVKFLWSELKGKPYEGADADYLRSMYKKFVEYGGHTRMFLANDYKTMYKDVRDLSKKQGKLKSTLDSALKYLDSMSDVSENATRFSVFVALNQEFDNHLAQEARRNDWTPEQMAEMQDTAHQRAANEALEITVNFTRKGAWAPLFNSLWAFSSANIGGNVRILRNLWRRGEPVSQNIKRTAAYMAYTIACGIPHALMCRWLMGDDDDGINKYDKIPDYVKDSNFIVPSPFGDGGYIKIPVPYGYNIMWVASNAIDSVLHGNAKPSTAVARIFGASFDNFNPVGGNSLVSFVPTIFRPIAEVGFNENSFGYALMPESTHSFKGDVPDSQKYWGTNPMWCRAVAETLNSWSFGSKVESGFIDVSPETIQHITESYLGGLGRVLTQALNLTVSPVTGAPVELKDVPVASTFFGKVGYGDTLNEFSKVRNKLQTKLNERELAKADPSMSQAEKQEVYARTRDAAQLKSRYDTLTSKMNAVRKQEKLNDQQRGPKYYETKEQLQKRKEFLMKELTKAAKQQGFDWKA